MRFVKLPTVSDGYFYVDAKKVTFFLNHRDRLGNEHSDRTSIFFGGGEDDYIVVGLPLDDVHRILEGTPLPAQGAGPTADEAFLAGFGAYSTAAAASPDGFDMPDAQAALDEWRDAARTPPRDDRERG